jgi:tetratricopeptide (TPR) repeat protein
LHALVESATQAGQQERLVDFLEIQLSREDTPAEIQEECLYMLLERGRPEVVVPHLERFAARQQEWFFAYQEYLQQRGLLDRLHRFWKAHVKKPDVSPSEKRAIAYQLLEAGYKNEAEDVFRELAGKAGADSNDVAQLLYLWGPRPREKNLEWIEQRGRAAVGGSERTSWLEHLMAVGQVDRIVRIVEEQGLLKDPPTVELVETYGRALIQLKEKEKLREVVSKQIAGTTSEPGLRKLAKLALEGASEEVAVAAYTKLLSLAPSDREAHRMIGRHAFFRGSYKRAKESLEKSLAADPGDYEVLFYLGEISRREKNLSHAKSLYRSALTALRADSRQSLEPQLLEARLWNRVGETEKAYHMFKKLRRENPNDLSLKGDFADFLIEHRRYDEAEALLNLRVKDG